MMENNHKILKSYSNFSQRISEVSSTMLFNVGKEQLLGKQLLLSTWELITDSPTSVQRGKVLNTLHRNRKGRAKKNKRRQKARIKKKLSCID